MDNKGMSEVVNSFFGSVFTTKNLNNMPVVKTLVVDKIEETISTCNIAVEFVFFAIGKDTLN